MTTTKKTKAVKLPAGLPKLPPVPEGFDRWEYMGKGWLGEPDAPWAWAYPKGLHTGITARDHVWFVDLVNRRTGGDRLVHYIVAVRDPKPIKRPAAKPSKAVGKALEAVAESRKRMNGYTPEKRAELEKHAREIIARGTKPERKCECSLTTRALGDGCDVCNPELAAEIAAENAKTKKPARKGRVVAKIHKFTLFVEGASSEQAAKTAVLVAFGKRAPDECVFHLRCIRAPKKGARS